MTGNHVCKNLPRNPDNWKYYNEILIVVINPCITSDKLQTGVSVENFIKLLHQGIQTTAKTTTIRSKAVLENVARFP